ncbi:MAG: AhpC/TSA family protein [Muribaculaceae bacterium]|nr:AhpC/TSA family protein [Muribaculaceae bacterium]
MMKKITMIAASIAAVAVMSCASAQAPVYSVTVPLTEDEDDLKAYILDYDTGAKLDSTIVENGSMVFRGTIEKPVLVQLTLDGARMGMFVLEPGDITGDSKTRVFTGTPGNQLFNDFGRASSEIGQRYREVAADTTAAGKERAKGIYDEYNTFIAQSMNDNINNPLGYYLFLQQSYDMSRPELDKAMQQYPNLAGSKRLARLRTALVNKEETSVGHKFKDFSITQPDGTVKKLSDYVGRGKYTLVDFWASWCGPCIRETKVLKEIYNRYADKGLTVLGVAVWDEPQNTLEAIKKHELPWESIINAQTIPTDIYGISGIPCIILFDPEGNIVSRDKQDAELIADVETAMATIGQ